MKLSRVTTFFGLLGLLCLGLFMDCLNPTNPTTSVPAAPTDVIAVAGNAQVVLTWTIVTGATSYNVFYQIGSSVTMADTKASPAMISSTTATITGLSNGTQYAFIVVAVNDGGSSTPSSVVTAAPAPPANLSVLSDKTSPTAGLLKGITGGTFYNGVANVTVSSFRMMRYDITRTMYNTIIGADPSNTSISGSTNDPVQTVSWYNVLVFSNKLSIAEGLTPVYRIGGSTNPADWGSTPTTTSPSWDGAIMDMDADGYRLPTEAEWMWAAMGGLSDSVASDFTGGVNVGGYTKAFAGSDGNNTMSNFVWNFFTSSSTTHPVGTKSANELGLFDLNGNVNQWVWDLRANYPTFAQTDPVGSATGLSRVVRGGSWADTNNYCNIVSRNYNTPEYIDNQTGFRLVCR